MIKKLATLIGQIVDPQPNVVTMVRFSMKRAGQNLDRQRKLHYQTLRYEHVYARPLNEDCRKNLFEGAEGDHI